MMMYLASGKKKHPRTFWMQGEKHTHKPMWIALRQRARSGGRVAFTVHRLHVDRPVEFLVVSVELFTYY